MKKWVDKKMEAQVVGTIIANLSPLDLSLLKPAYFTDNAFKTIFEHAWQLWVDGSPVDLVSVSGSLGRAGLLDFIGGMSFLSQLSSDVVSPSQDKHSRILQEYWQRRETHKVLSSSMQKLESGSPVLDVVGNLDHDAFHIIQDNGKKTHLDKEADLDDTLEAILNPNPDDCVPTPWGPVNEMIGGFRPQEMIVMAGRPGMGKTAMMVTAQRDLAKKGIASLSFSMDMGRRQLWNRYFAQESLIPVKRMERAEQLQPEEIDALRSARDELARLPFWVDSHPYRNLSDIRMIVRQMVLKHDIKVVFLDHIGKMQPEKSETREQEVSKMAQGLKALAKEFDVTTVPLVQLNRNVEQRADKRPMLSDLRESGAIEQEADIVLMGYRPEYYEMETFTNGMGAAGKVEIIGAKVRNGEAGGRILDFTGELTLISDPMGSIGGMDRNDQLRMVGAGIG